MVQLTFTLVLFLFPLAYSPGPGNIFFAANGARFGFRSTIRANLGYHLATWLVTAVIGFGFMRTLDSHPQVFFVLKLAGSVYVFWIAWKLFRSGAFSGGETAVPASFRDGVVLLVLNPKAYVIIALMFTQFLAQPGGGRVFSVLLITTVFTLNNLVAFTIWTLIGDRIADHFRAPNSARHLNMMFGTVLALVAVWMLLA